MYDMGAAMLGSNRQLRVVWTLKGYDVEYREFPGGHSYNQLARHACRRPDLAAGTQSEVTERGARNKLPPVVACQSADGHEPSRPNRRLKLTARGGHILRSSRSSLWPPLAAAYARCVRPTTLASSFETLSDSSPSPCNVQSSAESRSLWRPPRPIRRLLHSVPSGLKLRPARTCACPTKSQGSTRSPGADCSLRSSRHRRTGRGSPVERGLRPSDRIYPPSRFREEGANGRHRVRQHRSLAASARVQ